MASPSPLRDALSRLFARRYKTLFGTAKVYLAGWENTRIRVLDIQGTYQSATYVDERWCEPPFPYLGIYECIFEAAYPARDICMLGGGGYSFPKQVIARHPEARIDVVEVDPTITRIAREQFFLDRLERTYHIAHTDRLKTFNTDALTHLLLCAKEGRRYDAILNDCYAADVPEASLKTPESAALIKSCLTPRGMYLTNVITALEGNEAAPLHELVTVLVTQFSHVLAIPCDRTEPYEKDNVVVIASDRNQRLSEAIHLYDAL